MPRKATNRACVGRVCCVPRDSVVGDAEASLVVRLVQAHVDPSAVLLVPFLVGFAGAFLQECIGDLVVEVLLLEHLLVRELDLSVTY